MNEAVRFHFLVDGEDFTSAGQASVTVKKNLRKKFGENVCLLPLCSPAGDQCPRDMIRWVEPETPINDPNIIRENVPARNADPSMFDEAGCIRAARRISDEIFYALEEVTEYVGESDLIHKHFVPIGERVIHE